MLFEIRKKINEVIISAFPEDCKKYNDFYLVIEYKESESSFSSYSFDKKMIKVNTLSRNPGDIIFSLLIETAKHIDIKIRNETHIDKHYLNCLRKLLQEALEMNIISLDDLIHSKNDKIKSELQESFGTFSNWKVTSREMADNFEIYVFESFMIKNILKANQYYYDAHQTCWIKKCNKEEYFEEQVFIDNYKDMAEFIVISDNRFFIRPVYQLIVKSFSIEDNKLFRSYSYQFNKKTKVWEKFVMLMK